VVVLGDLMLDCVLVPATPMRTGTDVPGTVALRQGGSAANTARWLAKLGVRTTLIAAVGRDAAGRALVEAMRHDGVTPRVARVAGARTGRVGVLVAPGGERSFVADRGAADRLRPEDVTAAALTAVDAIHLPVYSLVTEPLASAARLGIETARAAGAIVSLDLASIGPLLARGRRAGLRVARDARPDLLFATSVEAEALLGPAGIDALLELSPVAVVKQGVKGATVLARDGDRRLRFEVATQHLAATDTTGAGDAFDAGFLASWLTGRTASRSLPASLQRAAVAGHRAAARHLVAGRPELDLG
jgi:sugar/nucleoside kinase (ribokinase family)